MSIPGKSKFLSLAGYLDNFLAIWSCGDIDEASSWDLLFIVSQIMVRVIFGSGNQTHGMHSD